MWCPLSCNEGTHRPSPDTAPCSRTCQPLYLWSKSTSFLYKLPSLRHFVTTENQLRRVIKQKLWEYCINQIGDDASGGGAGEVLFSWEALWQSPMSPLTTLTTEFILLNDCTPLKKQMSPPFTFSSALACIVYLTTWLCLWHYGQAVYGTLGLGLQRREPGTRYVHWALRPHSVVTITPSGKWKRSLWLKVCLPLQILISSSVK
jgi:hypothetical protein